MPQLDSDSFTYSDGALATVSSGKWTKLSGFSDLNVSGNAIATGAGDKASVITTWSGSATDHYSQCLITTTGNDGSVTIRSDTTSTFYLLDLNGTNVWDVYKCVTGTFTKLNTVLNTWSAGDTVYLEAQGTTLITKQNGTTRNNFTDSAIASGAPGMFMSGSGPVYDDWAGGDFSGGGGGTPLVNLLATLGVGRAN